VVVRGENYVITCPWRYGDETLKMLAHVHFKTTTAVLRFDEVEVVKVKRSPLKSDFLLVNANDYSDFIAVEVVTVDTTNTGELVQAYEDAIERGRYKLAGYKFGINWANVVKRTAPQLVMKGAQLARWGHQMYVLIQEATLAQLREWLPFPSRLCRGDITFLVFDYNRAKEGELRHIGSLSTMVSEFAESLMKMGTKASPSELIKKLKKLTPKARYEITKGLRSQAESRSSSERLEC
jgi:hypothetical protein